MCMQTDDLRHRFTWIAAIILIFLIQETGAEWSDVRMNSRFKDCPESPNCVSSRAAPGSHYIAPINYTGTMENARLRLLEIVADFVRARVVKEEDAYLHLEFTSLVFRFVDDLEFEFDDSKKLIHLRSASRTGYSDFGVNRRRCEAIRDLFNG